MTQTSPMGGWAMDAREAWRFRLDVPPVSMHAASDDSYLLVADVFGIVRSLDPGTGKVRWQRNFGMNNVHGVRATLAGATVLLEEGRLLRLDQQGQDTWATAVGALRSGFDATADGGLVALSAAVHEVEGDTVTIGAEVSLYGAQGEPLRKIRLNHAATRLRFTSARGDLVCTSPEGQVSFLKDQALARETELGSTLDGLVSCLDGSLILMPAGTDGIHVLSAKMQSLGVLEVGGPVEDVDVSEDGSAILVKERDGLIYLMDGHFSPRWLGRMDRPVIRVDLASRGNFAYTAESTGEILRFDFVPREQPTTKFEQAEHIHTLSPSATFDLDSASVRAGLGRLTFIGAQGTLGVLARPTQLLLCVPGENPRTVTLGFSAAHVTPDAAADRLAVWSNRRLAVVDVDGQLNEIAEQALAALTFCSGGDLAVGTATGKLRRVDAKGAERWAVRVGAGVLSVAQSLVDGHLVTLCADGSVVKVDQDGAITASRDFGVSVVAQPDVVGDDEALEGAAAPREDAEFWDKFARTFQLRVTTQGPVLFHGMGRILRLDTQLNVVHETHLGREIYNVLPLGDQLLAVEADAVASVLSPDLKVVKRFILGTRAARPAQGPAGPVLVDATDERLLLRAGSGAVVASCDVYPEPRALAACCESRQCAALLDTRLLAFDLSAVDLSGADPSA